MKNKDKAKKVAAKYMIDNARRRRNRISRF